MTRRRGISPVIATVIIVAVTIAVAVAVAFWMTGIIGLFTGFEQLQITNIFDDNNGIHVVVRNTGTQRVTVIDVFINGVSCGRTLRCTIISNNNNVQPDQNNQYSLVFNPGEQRELIITFTRTNAAAGNLEHLSPGASVEVKLLSASGKDYPKMLVLQQWRPS